MKTAAAREDVAFRQAPADAGWQGLDVHVLYEDLPAGLRAKQAVDCLEEQFPPQGELRLKMWRFDLLSEPALREEVANEAVRADLVLLSAHGQHGLPEAVSSWIREWLTQNTGEPPALALLFDAIAEGSPAANELLTSFRRAAEPGGGHVFPRFGDPLCDPGDRIVASLSDRAGTTTGLLAEMLG